MIIKFLFILLIALGAIAENESAEALLLRQKKILQLEKKQNQILQALIKINTKNKKLTYELDKISKEKELLEVSLEKNIKEIKSISTKLSDTRKMLTERVKTLGRFNGENILKSMLMFPKLSQIEKNIKMMGVIAAYDITSIQEYYNDKISLKEKIDKSRKRIAAIEELGKDIEKRKINLDFEYKTKSAFLEKIKKSKIFKISELKKIRSNNAALNIDDSGVLDFLTTESLADKKGKLISPIKGTISEKFGFQSFEDYSSFKNLGVFVTSELNQSVSSIYNGQVVEHGNLKGLGNYLIVDHGDNYYSVYANLKEIKVKKGDLIKTGQAIAQVDEQYIDNQSGLYFELRHYSKVLNPHLWIGGWNEATN